MRVRICAAMFATLTVGFAACGDSGSVRLHLELPSDGTLSPFQADTAATLTLLAESDGSPSEVLTYDLGSASGGAQIGELDVRDGVRLSLVAATPGGRLIGFGRARTPVAIEAGSEVTVPILFRRPFAYVAGASKLMAMDTTLEPGQQYRSMLADANIPAAVEVTRDGAEIVVFSGGNLSLLSTSDHRALGPSVSIGTGVTDLSVSPDSRWVVGLRSDGLVVVDLDELRAGGATPLMVPVAGASSVVADVTRAYVISGGARTCGVMSSLVAVSLLGDDTMTSFPLGTTASDIAQDRRTGFLTISEPCRGVVIVLDPLDDNASADLLSIPAPTSVATAGGRVWAMGSQGGSLVLGSIQLDGSDSSSVTLPAAEQSAVTDDLSEPGQSAEVRMTADSINAVDIAVLPDGERVALLADERFHADEIDGTIGFAPVIVFPAIDVTTDEYILIDGRSGGVIQRLRTTCALTTSISDWGPELIDPASWRCGDNPGQDVSGEQFIPTRLAVLYGAR